MNKSQTPIISGYVQLNARKYWVMRYAEIFEEGIFQYTKKKNDSEVRGAYNLKECNIKEAKYDSKKKMIVVNTISPKPITVKIMLKNINDHAVWLDKINKAKENAGINNLISKNFINENSDDGVSMVASEIQPQQLQFKSEINTSNGTGNTNTSKLGTLTIENKFTSVTPDNENNPLIIDQQFFTKMSPKEQTQIKQQTEEFLQDYQQKDFVLSDCQQNLQLYSQKVVYQEDFNLLKSFLIARKFIELLDNMEENHGATTCTAILVVLFCILVVFFEFISVILGKIPYSFGIFLSLNLILIPLFSQSIGKYVQRLRKQRQAKREKIFKLIGQGYFSHNINEVLYCLHDHKQRLSIQPYLKEVLSNMSSNILHLTYIDSHKESIKQVIYKENDKNTIICVEVHTDNNEILRLFKIDYSIFDHEGCHISYYSKAQFASFNQIKGKNSPSILQGIDFSINTQKLNPESSLGQYYFQAAQNGIFEKNSPRHPHTMFNGLKVQSQNIPQQQQQQQQQPQAQTNGQQNIQTDVVVEEVEEEHSIIEQPKEEKVQSNGEQKQTEGNPDQEVFESDYHKKCFEIANTKKDEYDDLIRLDDRWSKIHVKGPLKVHSRVDAPTDTTISRGETIINRNWKDIEAFLEDFSQKKKYDEMFLEGRNLQVFSNSKHGLKVQYNRMTGKMGVADRDFVYVQGRFEDQESKTVKIVAISVDHPDMPPVKKCIRGDLLLAGWLFEQLSENETRVVYSTLANPNGKLPKFVQNFAAKVQGYAVDKVKKILEKEKK